MERASLGGIGRALDTDRIWLPWNRELAEGESGRRTQEANDKEEIKIETAAIRGRSLSQRTWTISLLLLVVALCLIVITVFGLWRS